MPSETDLTKVIEEELCLELSDALQTIRHCVDQLSDEQVWWRPREEMNSIGNPHHAGVCIHHLTLFPFSKGNCRCCRHQIVGKIS